MNRFFNESIKKTHCRKVLFVNGLNQSYNSFNESVREVLDLLKESLTQSEQKENRYSHEVKAVFGQRQKQRILGIIAWETLVLQSHYTVSDKMQTHERCHAKRLRHYELFFHWACRCTIKRAHYMNLAAFKHESNHRPPHDNTIKYDQSTRLHDSRMTSCRTTPIAQENDSHHL